MASVTTDGKYLYIHSEVEGLLKIGTGFQYTMLGKVYKHNKEYRLKERGSVAYILGKLYYRSSKIAPAPLIEIDPYALEEVESVIAYDTLAPNSLFSEMQNTEIEFPHPETEAKEETKKANR